MNELLTSHTVLNNAAVSPEGYKIGTIEDVLIDPAYARIACYIVALDGIKDADSQLRALPGRSLQRSEDGSLLLAVDRKIVESSPRVRVEDILQDRERGWLEPVYLHYRQAIYWKDMPSSGGGSDSAASNSAS